ncbi:MAG: hypothetical protein O2913_10475 [Chloroflexi bacterium]|nr:hypothetical protein [Chloroflexota bacterium]
MTKITWFVVKLLWRIFRLALWLLAAALRLTIGLAWRQTFGRSAVFVRRDWNDRGIGRVRWSDLRNPRWDTIAGRRPSGEPTSPASRLCLV